MHTRLCLTALITIVIASLYSLNAEPGGEAGVNKHRQVQTHAQRFAVHDAELHETMSRLNALVAYSEQPGVPLSAESKQFLKELLDTVNVVVDSAQSLMDTEQLQHLGDEQQAYFSALADQLHDEAVAIDMNARTMNMEQMNEAFLNLNQTCIRCHQLFRSL